MGIIAIDLGTTTITLAAYTEGLVPAALESHAVDYDRRGDWVEFNPESYFSTITNLVAGCREKSANALGDGPIQVVLTGQAESLVVVVRTGRPLRNGISWLDMRSQKECADLADRFTRDACYMVTGQPEIIPTWPITKILWLRRNESELFSRIAKFLLLKDYVLYRLTGSFVGEHSIYPFSCYFDIARKKYWEEPLEYCGVALEQLPELVPPCSVVGELLPEVLRATGLPSRSVANAGTLDHFAGMIGTGNTVEGIISESAGTVSSIATFVSKPFASSARIPVYCGPFENTYIYLPVCESGGISLEWFRNSFASNLSFREIDEACAKRSPESRLIFLPYLTGVNPPEFDPAAIGVFYGAGIANDKFDFSLAIMYGVACLLRKNIDFFKGTGIKAERIISTGGGAKSSLWSRIKANVCNLPVVVPENQEAPCLGTAIIGAVTNGNFTDYASAIASVVRMKTTYDPDSNREPSEEKYHKFRILYDSLSPVFKQI
jgi:sugar (pentulose or hexulose) kinase